MFSAKLEARQALPQNWREVPDRKENYKLNVSEALQSEGRVFPLLPVTTLQAGKWQTN